ncbi:hypothetical protein L596_003269 [Steinernema carpocapsae]|uniref:Uncharacterized protein n=1 Tax=Steinernema carpocapsae TaxID=34508 RepID=A0A4U8USQ8_STECR|nr:hypothetical protein L596_003269 [Steinernema carpocapsae]
MALLLDVRHVILFLHALNIQRLIIRPEYECRHKLAHPNTFQHRFAVASLFKLNEYLREFVSSRVLRAVT